MKNFFLLLLFAQFLHQSIAQIPIIPGSKGFGINTVAGSGRHLDPVSTKIIRVTNLNDNGEGSLRSALEAYGPRTIIFEVSGTITLNSLIHLVNPYVTIAGQTAPSPGITIKGGNLRIETHDVLIQHLRFRMGWEGLSAGNVTQGNADALQFDSNQNAVYNIVVDHCSFSWAFDETIQFWHERVNNITFSNCLISESIQDDDSQGPGKGMIAGPGTGPNIFVTNNIFAHTHSRHPRSQGNGLVFANNIIYNFPAGGTNIGEGYSNSNYSILNNYYKRGLDAGRNPSAIEVRNNIHPSAKVYHSGNIVSSGSLYSGTPDIIVEEPPISVPDFIPIEATKLIEVLPLTSGARPADRDPVDNRIINDVLNGTGRHIESEQDVGGWPELPENHKSSDIPSNPFNDNNNDGYTNLEEWLHALSTQVEEGYSTSLQYFKDKQQICIYPNPASSFLRISGSKNLNSKMKIEFYNPDGVKLNESIIKNFPYSYKTNSLQPGMYFLKIIVADTLLATKKVLIK